MVYLSEALVRPGSDGIAVGEVPVVNVEMRRANKGMNPTRLSPLEIGGATRFWGVS